MDAEEFMLAPDPPLEVGSPIMMLLLEVADAMVWQCSESTAFPHTSVIVLSLLCTDLDIRLIHLNFKCLK